MDDDDIDQDTIRQRVARVSVRATAKARDISASAVNKMIDAYADTSISRKMRKSLLTGVHPARP